MARAQVIGEGEVGGAVGDAPVPHQVRHYERQSEAIDHGYALTLTVDHLQRGDGAGVSLQSPSVSLGAGFHLHGDVAYDNLLFPSLLADDGSHVVAGMSLVSVDAEAVWHGYPDQDVLPSIALGSTYGIETRQGITAHPHRLGGRLGLGIEVPLAFGRVPEGPTTEAGASLVVHYRVLWGLPGTDQLPVASNLYEGGLVQIGFRFYL